ncbi:MAG: methylaspartate mutase subunit S [Spirochaetes bacterium GWF1_41_5]|nr:MAG: methylaspartate mutase subunit S [Spirochaetes bacterium GWF1_41_5]HBE00859.1 methylaspartate mutase subunit S [Spirochaetia bacterium]
MNKPHIVTGVIGSDCHAVGNKIIEAFFSEHDFEVVNLGVMVSQDEFIDAAVETGSRAILVSSLYGHGEIDCEGMRGRCLERGLDPVLLYAGGNLVVGKSDFAQTEKKFKDMGFDRVFPPDADLEQAALLLKNDLEKIKHV